MQEKTSEALSMLWKNKHLTPQQLSVHDIHYRAHQTNHEPRLELDEVLISGLVPKAEEALKESLQGFQTSLNCTRSEQQRLENLQHEYGWMKSLRSNPDDGSYVCRWIHISSKFTEYIQGVLLALSDWTNQPEIRLESLQQLDRCIYENERFSIHGKHFSPFCHQLAVIPGSATDESPLFMSVPFLDWTINPGPTPPLRFEIDKRESYASSRTSSHPLRTILQHYYRLEDTSDRERTQVFTRHRPWQSNRETDLKVRRWYGHYPSGLNVDELWILVIDSTHIVTFSSNQTWKSRHPPLQLTARVAEVSFRNMRNNYSRLDIREKYTAMSHAVACVHGAVGMLHRSFWPDIPLPCTDRYGGYLGHLQYRLYRAPSTKLVMDLLQVQDELNIILQLTKKQDEVITVFRELLSSSRRACTDEKMELPESSVSMSPDSGNSQSEALPHNFSSLSQDTNLSVRKIAPLYRQRYAFRLPNPAGELLDLLGREYDDLKELRDNSNELVTRTVQLVNIRLEDHGQAILIFTIVTIIFLPLSFVTSFFGMNLVDIRNTNQPQSVFWISGISLTVVVLVGSLLLAFYGGHYWDKFRIWKDGYFRRRHLRQQQTIRSSAGTSLVKPSTRTGDEQGFRVLDARRIEGSALY